MITRKRIFHTFCVALVLVQLWGMVDPPDFRNPNYTYRNGLRSIVGLGGFFTFFTGQLMEAYLKHFSLVEATIYDKNHESINYDLSLNSPLYTRMKITCNNEQGLKDFTVRYARFLLHEIPEAEQVRISIKKANLITHREGDKVDENFQDTFRETRHDRSSN